MVSKILWCFEKIYLLHESHVKCMTIESPDITSLALCMERFLRQARAAVRVSPRHFSTTRCRLFRPFKRTIITWLSAAKCIPFFLILSFMFLLFFMQAPGKFALKILVAKICFQNNSILQNIMDSAFFLNFYLLLYESMSSLLQGFLALK